MFTLSTKNISSGKMQHVVFYLSLLSRIVSCGGFLNNYVPFHKMGYKANTSQNSATRRMSTIGNSTTAINMEISSNSIILDDSLLSLAPPMGKWGDFSVESMPWKSSIQGLTHELTFMPYYSHTLSIMHDRLSNLRPLDFPAVYKYKESLVETKIHHGHDRRKKARIINECYESDEYQKIRMTYYDAGETQVFNSLWYPRAELGIHLPLLGVDLIQFKNRFLVVIDFQPLQKEQHSPPEVEDVWREMPDVLKGKMSDRFYDHKQFFSNHMLFGRFGREEASDGLVNEGGDLWDAFQKYLSLHIDLVQDVVGSKSCIVPSPLRQTAALTLERHREYDNYSAERDPAHALFVRIFGKHFADGFVYDFLFSLSD